MDQTVLQMPAYINTLIISKPVTFLQKSMSEGWLYLLLKNELLALDLHALGADFIEKVCDGQAQGL
jgi:hypothetical protein